MVADLFKDSYSLLVRRDVYILQRDADSEENLPTLIISRSSGSIALKYERKLSRESARSVCALLGVVDLPTRSYLVLVATREEVVRQFGIHPVYAVKRTTFLPFGECRTQQLDTSDALFIDLLKRDFESGSLYFSYSLDLTQSLQRLVQTNSMEPNPDDYHKEFMWNRSMITPITRIAPKYDGKERQDLGLFCLTFVTGLYRSFKHKIRGLSVVYDLVSRKSVHRVGTRYHTRGIDHASKVANFVETEQILSVDQDDIEPATFNQLPEGADLMSWITVRGSIPLFWRHALTGRYAPDLKIDHDEHEEELMRKHLEYVSTEYGGDVVLINLINGKKSEGRLEEAFRKNMDALADDHFKYVFFDFHNECRNMQWQNINKLVDKVWSNLQSAAFLRVTTADRPSDALPLASSGRHKLLQTQKGVTRVNCIDCLDRTNVVQSVFARKMLETMMRERGIMDDKQVLEDLTEFNASFRNVWADNADALSILYSGTPALKTDFTRTGKRTIAGNWQDLRNSVTRYVLNNYYDGARQDALDMLHGVADLQAKSLPDSVIKSRGFSDERAKTIAIRRPAHLKGALAFAAGSYVLIVYVSLIRSTDILFHIQLLLVWIAIVATTFKFYIDMYGKEAVDRPRLVHRPLNT